MVHTLHSLWGHGKFGFQQSREGAFVASCFKNALQHFSPQTLLGPSFPWVSCPTLASELPPFCGLTDVPRPDPCSAVSAASCWKVGLDQSRDRGPAGCLSIFPILFLLLWTAPLSPSYCTCVPDSRWRPWPPAWPCTSSFKGHQYLARTASSFSSGGYFCAALWGHSSPLFVAYSQHSIFILAADFGHVPGGKASRFQSYGRLTGFF